MSKKSQPTVFTQIAKKIIILKILDIVLALEN
jgi:hypothetical protein